MPLISQTEKTKSVEFNTSIKKLLNLIDDITELIPEGIYLDIMKELQVVYNCENPIEDIVNEINTNPLYLYHQLRAKYSILPPKKNDGRVLCEFCDCRVMPRCLRDHHATKKCRHIQKTKTLSAFSTKEKTRKLAIMRDRIKHLSHKVYYQTLVSNWKKCLKSQWLNM